MKCAAIRSIIEGKITFDPTSNNNITKQEIYGLFSTEKINGQKRDL